MLTQCYIDVVPLIGLCCPFHSVIQHSQHTASHGEIFCARGLLEVRGHLAPCSRVSPSSHNASTWSLCKCYCRCKSMLNHVGGSDLGRAIRFSHLSCLVHPCLCLPTTTMPDLPDEQMSLYKPTFLLVLLEDALLQSTLLHLCTSMRWSASTSGR